VQTRAIFGSIAVLAAVAATATGVAACSAPAPAGPRHAAAREPDRPAASGSPSASGVPGQPVIGARPPAADTIDVTSAPGKVAAKGAALADATTGQVLWSRDFDTERPIGSITKVMTALLVIQTGQLGREIRVPKAVLHYVAKYQAESAGLHPGDVVTVQDLLEALLLASGCDAAYILATTFGPGMPAFLARMNVEAAKLGMTHTHFTSPDGLPYPTEYSTYSTPHDLLILGMTAMRSPVFRSIVSQSFFHLTKGKHHHSYWWDNTNGLIGNYRGAEGIKTGYTDAAKHCLLFEAARHGRPLVGVVLGSPVTGPDAASQAATRVLNWGFSLKPAAAGAQAAGTG
jgi:D-alanyl-D-alanine carboxypeptidase (penicillin-binding protein 5/6)